MSRINFIHKHQKYFVIVSRTEYEKIKKLCQPDFADYILIIGGARTSQLLNAVFSGKDIYIKIIGK